MLSSLLVRRRGWTGDGGWTGGWRGWWRGRRGRRRSSVALQPDGGRGGLREMYGLGRRKERRKRVKLRMKM